MLCNLKHRALLLVPYLLTMVVLIVNFASAAEPNDQSGFKSHEFVAVNASDGMPISGAKVIVTRVSKSQAADSTSQRSERMVEATADSNGKGRFFVPERFGDDKAHVWWLYVEHPQFMDRKIPLSNLLLSEGRDKQAGSAVVKLHPARDVVGTILHPDGRIATNVAIKGFTYPGERVYGLRPLDMKLTEVEAVSDAEGHFHVKVVAGGYAACWLLPDEESPVGFVIGPESRDVGAILLTRGIPFTIRLLDTNEIPVKGVKVTAVRRGEESPELTAFLRDASHPTMYSRIAETNDEGLASFSSVDAGAYLFSFETSHIRKQNVSLAGVFANSVRTVSHASAEFVIPAYPAVDVVVRAVDAKGQLVDQIGFHVHGTIGGDSVLATSTSSFEQGGRARVPAFMNEARVILIYGINGAILVRPAPGLPFVANLREVPIGTLKGKEVDIDVIRFRATTLAVDATDALGEALEGYTPTATVRHPLMDDVPVQVKFAKRPRGWETVGLLPGGVVKVGVKKTGWTAIEQDLQMKEGEYRKVTVVATPAN